MRTLYCPKASYEPIGASAHAERRSSVLAKARVRPSITHHIHYGWISACLGLCVLDRSKQQQDTILSDSCTKDLPHMSVRFTRLLQLCGLVFALLLVSQHASVASASFTDGQKASLVLGQASFTTWNTQTTADGLQYPHSIAIDPATNKVFVSDAGNHRILRYASFDSLSNGASAEMVFGQTNFSGNLGASGANRLKTPQGIAIDSNGRLWVADSANNRVLRFDNAATANNGVSANVVLGQANFIDSSTGTAINRLYNPGALTLSSDGTLWVADARNHRVLRFDNAASKNNGADANAVLGQPDFMSNSSGLSQNQFNAPRGIAIESDGTLWVSDATNHRVLRFDDAASKDNGANADAVLGQNDFVSKTTGITSSKMHTPYGIVTDSNGTLWVVSSEYSRVMRFDHASSKGNGAAADGVVGQPDLTTVNIGISQTTLNYPMGATLDPTGSLWVADYSNNRVLRFSSLVTQTISFNALADKALGEPAFTISATPSSGLEASFTSLTSSVCSVSGSTVSLLATGTCTIQASQAGDNMLYLAASYVEQSFEVKTLPTITWAAPSPITYGTALGSSQLNATADTAGTFSYSHSSGSNLDAGIHTLTVTFTPNDTAKYVTAQKTVHLTVTKAPLTITAQNASRNYGSANPSFSVAYDGFVLGQSKSNLSGSLAITTTATINSPVGSYSIVASGLSSSNYQIEYVNGSLSVNKVPLTVSVQNASRQYGAANPSFAASYDGFVLGQTSAVLGGSLAFSTSANASSSPGIYSVNASGLSSSNYEFTYVSGQLTVVKAPFTVTVHNSFRQYGNNNPAFAFSYDDFANGEDDSVLDGSLTITSTATINSSVGTYPIIASGLSSSNYDIQYTTGTLTVNKAPLTITAQNATRVYGAANPSFTVSYSGFKNSQNESVLSGSLLITSTATTDSTVGTYPIVPSGLSSNNYAITFVNGSLSVTKAPLTITASNVSRNYGAANPSFNVSYSGFKNSEDKAVLSGSLLITSTADASSPVGSYPIVPSGLTSTNYDITFNNGTLSVTKAPLTITAQNASRSYGAVNPSFTVNYNGFALSEDESVLDGTLLITTTADLNSTVGSYPIVASGLTSNNYTITLVDGTLTITKAPLTITAQNASKIVDSANPSFGVNYSGFVNGEDEGVLGGTLIITTTADLNSTIGNYPIVPSGLSSNNYEISFVNGTLTVDAALAISWASPSAISYGTALSTNQLNASANIAGTFSYEPALGSLLPAGTHTITATFTPTDNRYNPTQQTMLLTVNKAPLTVTAQNASRSYGAANPDFAVSYSGFVNGENASVLGGTLAFSSANASSSVGSYPITPSGLTSSNYAISFVDGTLTINKATLTITAQNASRSYGAANPDFAVSYSGFVNGENASALGGTLVFNTSANASSPAGSYPIVPSGLTSGNYTISFVNGTLTVTAKPATQWQVFIPLVAR